MNILNICLDDENQVTMKQYRQYFGVTLFSVLLLLVITSLATAQQATENQYLNMSIAELTQLDVTSVTGVEEQWFHAPAAVYVITPEDIERTGHQTLADLLRIVPGLNVASTSSNTWSIGARGMRGNYSDNLLMQIDGRSVDDALSSFVRWDTLDMILDDIASIEVIRGPGATLWGADAVNGVINITTKPAGDTQGLLINAVTGTYEQANVSLRYGGEISDNMHFRIWGKSTFRDSYQRSDGSDAHDDWNMFTGGFRLDNHAPDGLDWSLIGGVTHSNQLSGTTNVPSLTQAYQYEEMINNGRVDNFFLQANISKLINENNKYSLLMSYEHNSRSAINNLQLDRDVINIDYRHRYALNQTQLLVWGVQWQMTADNVQNTPYTYYAPESDTLHNYSAFIQSSTKLFVDSMTFVIGTKIEHNAFAGFQLHPSARLSWTPDSNNTLWAAFSRAPRSPSRGNTDVTFIPFLFDAGDFGGPSGVLFAIPSSGSRDLKPEELIAYEAGYRTNLTSNLTLDAACFYNVYDDLLSVNKSTFQIDNNMSGRNIGVELNMVWQPAPTLRLESGYSYAHTKINGNTFDELNFNTAYPENQFHFRTYLDIGKDLELNGAIYYVDEVPQFFAGSYVRMDAGLTWRINDHTKLSFWGQNLLDHHHTEMIESELNRYTGEVPRSFYMQLNMTF